MAIAEKTNSKMLLAIALLAMTRICVVTHVALASTPRSGCRRHVAQGRKGSSLATSQGQETEVLTLEGMMRFA